VALAINNFLHKSVWAFELDTQKDWTIIDFDSTITLDREVVDARIVIHKNSKEKKV